MTPEESAQMDEILSSNGISTSSPSSGGWYSQLTQNQTPATPPTPNIGQVSQGELMGGAKKIGSSIAEGAQKLSEQPTVTFDPKHPLESVGKLGKTVASDVGTMAETGLGAAAGAVRSIFAPVTAVTQKAADLTGIHPLDNFVNDPKNQDFVARLNQLATEHPEAAKNLGDALTVGMAAVGSKGDVNIPSVKSGIEALKGMPSDVADIAGAVKGKVSNIIASKGANKALDAVSATEDTMSKADRFKAMGEDRLAATKLGGKQYVPSGTEQNAAKILDGKVTGNPVKDIQVVKNEIATRGADAEKYLADNAVPITNQEHADMFASKRIDAEKYLTNPELKAYDEQVKLFSKQLPGRGSYDTDTYYKALKDYESNVADHLPRGKDALISGDPTASAKLRAARDVRSVVRDMIGEKNPEFKPKMFDLASLYDVKHTIMTKADQLSGNAVTRFVQKHPVITTAVAGEAGRKIMTGGF